MQTTYRIDYSKIKINDIQTVEANKITNPLVLKVNTGTTEGTNLYTYNGSVSKTIDIKAGTGITLNATAGSLTISSAVDSVGNPLVLKVNTGTTEGTNLYTYNGSTGKTIDIKAGTNINLVAAANTLTINGIPYTAGSGLALSNMSFSIVSDANLPGAPTTTTAALNDNTTKIATTAYVMTALGNISNAMLFKGTIGTSGTITSLPASHKIGDTYRVITAGTYAGQVCEVGDMIICVVTGTTDNNSDWTIVQTNADGIVTGPTGSTDLHIATFNGTTGKIIKDSGYTIATSVPSGAVFTDTKYTAGSGLTLTGTVFSHTVPTGVASSVNNSGRTYIQDITLDSFGHVIGLASATETVTNTTYSAGTGLSLSDTTFNLASSGVTAGSYGTSAAITLTGGGTFTVPYYTVDTYGRIVSSSNIILTLPNSASMIVSTSAPTSTDGGVNSVWVQVS